MNLKTSNREEINKWRTKIKNNKKKNKQIKTN